MSNINFMTNLLDGVEVEWKLLGDLSANISSGKNKEKSEHGAYPVFGSTGIIGWTNNKVYEVEQILIARVGANAGRVNITKGEYDVSDNTLIVKIKECVILKYLYYYLVNLNLNQFAQGAGQPLITGGQLKLIQIPIPCPTNPKKSLEIQAGIVRILDAFTELTTELTAELTTELIVRKKQYNHYRDQMLSFEEGEVEWKTLGDVAEIGTGSHDTQDAIEDGEYIFYARGREPLMLNVYDFDETAIITAGDGAGVGKVFHYAQGKYALHQRAYRIVPREVMEPRFVYHYIAAYFYAYIQKASVSSSVTSLRRPMFLNFPVPVPSLEEQARIVAILDEFDALTNSITEGLPREIELRRKQYEYYRDLLLSFPKSEEAAA